MVAVAVVVAVVAVVAVVVAVVAVVAVVVAVVVVVGVAVVVVVGVVVAAVVGVAVVVGGKMNHKQFTQIRRLFYDLAAPRRHGLKVHDLVDLRLSVTLLWHDCRQAVCEMKKTEKLLKKIIDSDKLDIPTKRLAISQLTRLTAITDKADQA